MTSMKKRLNSGGQQFHQKLDCHLRIDEEGCS